MVHSAAVHVVEVGVLEGGQRGNASVGVERDQTGKQIDLEFVQGRRMLSHGHAAELRERRFEIVQFQSVGPVILVRGTEDLEDLEDLVDLRVAHEERSALDHLSEDAACGPEVDAKTVGLLSEENLRAAVPERDDLVGVRLNWQAERSGQSEVSQLDIHSLRVDEQVLWLQISVEDAVLVQVDQRLQDLIQEELGLLFRQRLVALLLHVLFQIVLQVLEDQVQLVLTVDDFFEPAVHMKQKWRIRRISDESGLN